MPEGFFDASTIADRGMIADWFCNDNPATATAITKLWIPNTITQIGGNAFKGCVNLTEVRFEEGGDLPLSLGLMSFAQCTSLSSLILPARLIRIGKGCFRDSTALEEIEIGEGNNQLQVADHLFDNCAGRVALEEIVADEVDRRDVLRPQIAQVVNGHRERHPNQVLQGLRLRMLNGQMDPIAIGRGLATVYDMMTADPDFAFDSYANRYGDACDHFSTIEDWGNASDDELRKVMAGRYIRKVAALNWGEVKDAEFQAADKRVFRETCSAIYNLEGCDAENGAVAELEERYTQQFPVRRSAAFYRMIAAIRPELVVQVPAIAKLAPVYAWLTGAEIEEAYNVGWYELSRSVRSKLQELLTGRSIYQVGVFTWFLAEAFREDLRNRMDAQRRKDKVLNVLRTAGLL